MTSTKSIWFHLGHALERARHAQPRAERKVLGLAERRAEAEDPSRDGHGLPAQRPAQNEVPSADELVAAAIAVSVDHLLARWTGSRTPGFTKLLRACAAGATAAVLVDLVRPLLRGDRSVPILDEGTADRLIAGASQGLVYGGVVEPRLPGSSVMKGAIYGSAEYAADPVGGLGSLLGSHTPQRRLPFVGELLDGVEPDDRAYLEHLVFGIALAILYESSPSSNGIPDEDE
ncbi:MAG: hypothetical protein AAF389_06000 [Gemmatimonadota bacterium]